MSAINDYDGPSLATSSTSTAEQIVPIHLTTSLSQYAIPSGPYMVPISWRRTHLSTLVNKLVSSTSESTGAVPFDFIIDSSLLRTTLGEFLESSGLTSESTLNIEYVRSTLPPTRLAAFEHDDWVSSVDCTYAKSRAYMTSSFDGSIRIFSPSNPTEAAHTFSTVHKSTLQSGRSGGLTCARWTVDCEAVVTGGMDGRVQLWSLSEEEGWRSGRKWVGEAHNGPVGAVDCAQGTDVTSVISGGWDGVVAVWDDLVSSVEVESDEEEEDGANKRRKTVNGSKSTKTTGSKAGSIEPTMVLYHAQPTAHAVTGAKNVFTPTSRVSSLLFERSPSGKDANRAWSTGYNGQLKGWDLSSGGVTHTSLSLPSSTSEARPMLSLAQLASGSLVVGTTDRAVHLFDIRSSSNTLGVHIANAHRGPVDVVAAHPIDGNLFASGSGLEGGAKVWDVRSCKKALFTLDGGVQKGEKGTLALGWSRDGQEVVAGGKDKCITVFRGSSIGVSETTV
ncbi:WD40 repeat [Kalmanozyma brasiliensis GHG001]|uniref:NLE domain-containing protein n=1 Tax=Kalmanozyma brasiliensis (strain GHG001) TaxID=1365824 RepID=V5ETS3_KALBG|nr:WD40 repeat [Kalmanozyma brasiliensis GHG001]EST05449.1 WD40 repeat [Kalmanozyma brasiliensis GHG001]